MSEEYSAADIANSFVRQYYALQATDPDKLHRFYGADSNFEWLNQSQGHGLAVGTEAIHEKIMALGAPRAPSCPAAASPLPRLRPFLQPAARFGRWPLLWHCSRARH